MPTPGSGTKNGLTATDRRALLSVAVQFFVNGALFASFIPRLPEIRDDVGVTTATLGVLLAVGALSGLGGSVVVGPLIERFGTRSVLIGGAAALCCALPVIGFATGPAVLLVGLAALSVFDVLVDSAMNIQGSWLSGRRSSPVMNRLHGLWSLGTVVGGFGATRLAAAGVSLQWHLLGVSCILGVVLVFVGRGLLREDEHVDERGDVDPATSRRARLKIPLVMLGVAGACSIAMEMTSSDWAAFRLSDDFDATPGVAGLAYVAFTAGMTSGRFGGDSMVVRFGARRVADVGIAMTVSALAFAAFFPNRWVVMVAYLVAGLGIATQFPKLYDDAAKYRGRPGAGLGALTGGSRIAMLVTPVVVGSLASTSLSVGAATAMVTLPAAAVFVLVTRRSV
ncbi:MFS transporter [Ilumatobacter nonamiensis]|uniref:MFS transporter n=1 Tax=Ilumatobacter nonamiensis TaxID=467093 RepID=UPI00130D9E1E|nr:MFS transporter [Ilumatobacter nonamiensis]